MKLITESINDIEYIKEQTKEGKPKQYIQGTFLVAEEKNKNGRLYPQDILSKEVGRYMQEVVKQNRGYGELGHPQGPQINLDRVSHIITELTEDKNRFIGKALITATPMGEIVKGLIESGASLGASSRGLGKTEHCPKRDCMIVTEGFKLATAADIVADPSAPNAFVNGIMESAEWLYDPVQNTYYEEKLDVTRKQLQKMSRSQIEEQKLKIFESYVSSLANKN